MTLFPCPFHFSSPSGPPEPRSFPRVLPFPPLCLTLLIRDLTGAHGFSLHFGADIPCPSQSLIISLSSGQYFPLCEWACLPIGPSCISDSPGPSQTPHLPTCNLLPTACPTSVGNVVILAPISKSARTLPSLSPFPMTNAYRYPSINPSSHTFCHSTSSCRKSGIYGSLEV